MKLYIGNLHKNTTEEDLMDLFGSMGKMTSIKVIKDQLSGLSRGFGFIEFDSREGGNNAISRFDNYSFQGMNIVVNEARERAPQRSRNSQRWQR